MEKTELMKKYEETTYLDDDPQALIQIIEYLKDCVQGYKAKAEELVKERAKPTITYQAVDTFQEIIRNQCDEITALKEKAEAYDRLMSGGKKTMKELANLLSRAVVVNGNGDIESFAGKPRIDLHYGFWYLDEDDEDYEDDRFLIPNDIVDYTGDWKDSLTLPDGWEG